MNAVKNSFGYPLVFFWHRMSCGLSFEFHALVTGAVISFDFDIRNALTSAST